ncbi:hypothetical protein OCK74_25505 [Chitinophagaceae bacterium LB-8]|uniref:DUF4878 domain-containing protein n=1 Tax=Paraflavisolibacter caeni TaxID=2982496 RepID=A0A9X3BAC0_9BACT|nr:hypothetical protein [Paraflavisolibacter caeni]MCU7552501.1 hypothetical protein [Paraflavisolibacter caeni]
MRSVLFFSFLFLQFFCACKNSPDRSDTTQTSENDVDAARNFIRLALDGKYDRAREMVINDSLNYQFIDQAERYYKQRMDISTRMAYRSASINILSVVPQNDSVSIVHYSNSFKKQKDSLKVVNIHGQWMVDMKYSFPSTTGH